jgi:hypothetical protein
LRFPARGSVEVEAVDAAVSPVDPAAEQGVASLKGMDPAAKGDPPGNLGFISVDPENADRFYLGSGSRPLAVVKIAVNGLLGRVTNLARAQPVAAGTRAVPGPRLVIGAGAGSRKTQDEKNPGDPYPADRFTITLLFMMRPPCTVNAFSPFPG